MPYEQRSTRSPLRAWLLLGWAYLCTPWRFLRWRRALQDTFRELEGAQVHMKQTLLVVRHGQTTWNVEHRLPGHLSGVALNDVGRQQAERLAEALKALPISAIISSPLERAYHTAEYLAQGRDIEIREDPALMDTSMGSWAGQRIEDVSKNDPAWKEYVKNPAIAPEGVETFPAVQQRVVAAVERWRTQDGIGAYPAFVAHADVIKLLLAYYMGLEATRAGTIHIDNASVSLIEFNQDQPAHIVSIGWTPRPGWLTPPIAEPPKAESATQEVGEQKS